MIRQSFIFLKGIGKRKEQGIWQQGVESWDAFLKSEIKGISKAMKARHDQLIRLAKLNLIYDNPSYFNDVMPKGEMWRLYPEFRGRAAFLDIETSGWDITVVGIYDGNNVKQFVRGFNLNKSNILQEIYKHKILLTFNGSSFDIPMLNRALRHEIKLPHVDLRHACSKVGLNGGLKKIEKRLGIKRPEEVRSMLGSEAVYCWEMWRHTGKKEYLDLLLKYNAEDILNLEPLADYAVNKLWKGLRKSGSFI